MYHYRKYTHQNQGFTDSRPQSQVSFLRNLSYSSNPVSRPILKEKSIVLEKTFIRNQVLYLLVQQFVLKIVIILLLYVYLLMQDGFGCCEAIH